MLPPEITSANMYSGPGSQPLMATASAWDSLASHLESFATGYSSTIASLQGQAWTGPASEAMASAAAPYAAWATNTGAQVEHAASQARAAAAAYETAHTAVVPPALVSANRTRLAQLVASNLFGQNTPHIAATESDYAGMWAQNTHAMYGYATSASSASQLPPFEQPPETTNPAGGAAQAGAAASAAGASGSSHSQFLSQLLSAVPQQLQGLASSSPTPDTSIIDGLLGPVDNFKTAFGPTEISWAAMRTVGSFGSFFINIAKLLGTGAAAPAASSSAGMTAGAAEAAPSAVMAGTGAAGVAGSGTAGVGNAVLASLGEATPVGQLSVPQTWAEATPVAVTSEEPLLLAETEYAAAPEAAPMAGMGPMAGAAGAAAGAAAGRASVSAVLRVGSRAFKMPRHAAGG
jgi:PPE-repeat protein